MSLIGEWGDACGRKTLTLEAGRIGCVLPRVEACVKREAAVNCLNGCQAGPFKQSRWTHDSVFLSWFRQRSWMAPTFKFYFILLFLFCWSDAMPGAPAQRATFLIFNFAFTAFTSGRQVLMWSLIWSRYLVVCLRQNNIGGVNTITEYKIRYRKIKVKVTPMFTFDQGGMFLA